MSIQVMALPLVSNNQNLWSVVCSDSSFVLTFSGSIEHMYDWIYENSVNEKCVPLSQVNHTLLFFTAPKGLKISPNNEEKNRNRKVQEGR